jgi:hypothetical protein
VEEGNFQESNMTKFRYPSIEEIEVMQRAARRARAEALASLVKAAAAGIKAFFTHPAPVRVKIPRHA